MTPTDLKDQRIRKLEKALEDARYEIRYLKRQLGMDKADAWIVEISRALGLSIQQATIVNLLWRVYPLRLTANQLIDRLPLVLDPIGADSRSAMQVRVQVHRLRMALGASFIVSKSWSGYGLSSSGKQTLEDKLVLKGRSA